MRSGALQVVSGLADRFGGQTPAGPWADPPHTAVTIPIRSNRLQSPAGFLVAGISPRLALDDTYRDFLQLVASQISSSIVSARQHEEEKQRADALAEIDRAKSVFFSNVSHEFRTPLTLMLSPLEEALSDDRPLSGYSQRERISTAHSNGLRLLKLVNNLLDFARVEAGSVMAAPQPTDLAALTEDLVSVFETAFETAGIELDTAIEPVGTLDVDVDVWEATVLNLVSNALKYTLQGSVRVELRRRADAVELSVADTGVGIVAEEQGRVFERFFRSSNEAGRSFEGSGIGLALVSELVKLHGGLHWGGQHAGPRVDVHRQDARPVTAARSKTTTSGAGQPPPVPAPSRPTPGVGSTTPRRSGSPARMSDRRRSWWWTTTATCSATSARCSTPNGG